MNNFVANWMNWYLMVFTCPDKSWTSDFAYLGQKLDGKGDIPSKIKMLPAINRRIGQCKCHTRQQAFSPALNMKHDYYNEIY